MATSAGEIEVKLTLDASQFQKLMGQSQQKVAEFNSGVKQLLTTFGEIFTLGALVGALKTTLEAYAENELAVTRLSLALKNQGLSVQSNVTHLKGLSDSLSHVSTSSGNVIMEAQTLLTTFGLQGAQLDKTTQAALDMSSALGIDLHTSALLLGKAFAGETATLARYGITVDKTLDDSKKFDAVMVQLAQRFGGAAQAEIGTVSGKYKMMQNTLVELTAQVGEKLVPAFNFWYDVLKRATDALTGSNKAEKEALTGRQLTIQALQKEKETLALLVYERTRFHDISMDQTAQEAQSKIEKINLALEREKAALAESSRAIQTKTVTDGIALTAQQIALDRFNDHMQENAKATANLRENAERHIRDAIGLTSQADRLAMEKRLDDAKHELQLKIKYIDQEVQERLIQSAASFENQANFSQQLTVRLVEDTKTWETAGVDAIVKIRDQMASGVADMILEGRKFADVFTSIWKGIARAVIEYIVQMIAKLLILLALEEATGTQGAASGIGQAFSFMANGGMIREPSVITGLRSGKQSIAGEAGPEAVVPMNTANSEGGGGGVTINISGHFVEGDPASWQKLINEKIVPAIRRFTMATPTGPFTRRRGTA